MPSDVKKIDVNIKNEPYTLEVSGEPKKGTTLINSYHIQMFDKAGTHVALVIGGPDDTKILNQPAKATLISFDLIDRETQEIKCRDQAGKDFQLNFSRQNGDASIYIYEASTRNSSEAIFHANLTGLVSGQNAPPPKIDGPKTATPSLPETHITAGEPVGATSTHSAAPKVAAPTAKAAPIPAHEYAVKQPHTGFFAENCSTVSEEDHRAIRTIQQGLIDLKILDKKRKSKESGEWVTNVDGMWGPDAMDPAFHRLLVEIQVRSTEYHGKVDGLFGEKTRAAIERDTDLKNKLSPELIAAIETLYRDPSHCEGPGLLYHLATKPTAHELETLKEKAHTESKLFSPEPAPAAAEGGMGRKPAAKPMGGIKP